METTIKHITLAWKQKNIRQDASVCEKSSIFATTTAVQSGYHKDYKTKMVKHIILWTLNPELSASEKESVKQGIKEGLEALVGKVPGLLQCKVNISGRLDTSNCDVMLDSTLESPEALKGYATHPEHVAVADTKVRPYTVQRVCLDYEE